MPDVLPLGLELQATLLPVVYGGTVDDEDLVGIWNRVLLARCVVQLMTALSHGVGVLFDLIAQHTLLLLLSGIFIPIIKFYRDLVDERFTLLVAESRSRILTRVVLLDVDRGRLDHD